MATTVNYENTVSISNNEQTIYFEVTYRLCPTDGDVIVETFYAEAVTYDANDWCTYEKVPMWFYEHLKDDVEDYKYNLPALAAEDAECAQES